jgi:hypothetical protein
MKAPPKESPPKKSVKLAVRQSRKKALFPPLPTMTMGLTMGAGVHPSLCPRKRQRLRIRSLRQESRFRRVPLPRRRESPWPRMTKSMPHAQTRGVQGKRGHPCHHKKASPSTQPTGTRKMLATDLAARTLIEGIWRLVIERGTGRTGGSIGRLGTGTAAHTVTKGTQGGGTLYAKRYRIYLPVGNSRPFFMNIW